MKNIFVKFHEILVSLSLVVSLVDKSLILHMFFYEITKYAKIMYWMFIKLRSAINVLKSAHLFLQLPSFILKSSNSS